MTLQVRGDRVFIKPLEQPSSTDSGILIIYDRQRSTIRGTVVAVGEGPVTSKGVRLPHWVKVGEDVIFSPDAGSEVFFEKEVLISMKEDDILAVVTHV